MRVPLSHKMQHPSPLAFRNQEMNCDNHSKKKKDKNPNTGNSYILKCQKYISLNFVISKIWHILPSNMKKSIYGFHIAIKCNNASVPMSKMIVEDARVPS